MPDDYDIRLGEDIRRLCKDVGTPLAQNMTVDQINDGMRSLPQAPPVPMIILGLGKWLSPEEACRRINDSAKRR